MSKGKYKRQREHARQKAKQEPSQIRLSDYEVVSAEDQPKPTDKTDYKRRKKKEESVGLREAIKRSSFTDWCIAIFTFVLTAVAIYQGGIIAGQLDTMREDQRPYVVVKDPQFIGPFKANVSLLAEVTIRNVGKAPAVGTYDIAALVPFIPTEIGARPSGTTGLEVQAEFVDKTFKDLETNTQIFRATLMPLRGEDDIAPGGDYFGANPQSPVLTQTQMDSIESPDPMGGALFFVGLITYTDSADARKHPYRIADYPYRTEFCWYVSGTDHTVWKRCKFHNVIR